MIAADWPDTALRNDRPGLGHLFVARSHSGKLWIGWSNAPQKTMRTIQTYSPEAVHLVSRHHGSVTDLLTIYNTLRAERIRRTSSWFRATELALDTLGRYGLFPGTS